ncbi:MAG TPA: hypothetical protein VF329_08925 [Gammaproteobacteria bacterium]
MLRQRHEARLHRPMAEAFAALVNAAARGRWATRLLEAPLPPPRAGMSYEQQRGSVLRRGRVVQCIPPVSITLRETLHDPPCRVELRLRWRLEPVEAGCFLRLDAGIDLNGPASLRRRHWSGRIRAHCLRMIDALRSSLPPAEGQDGSLVSGQNTGSSSIAVTNVKSVNGTPTLR